MSFYSVVTELKKSGSVFPLSLLAALIVTFSFNVYSGELVDVNNSGEAAPVEVLDPKDYKATPPPNLAPVPTHCTLLLIQMERAMAERNQAEHERLLRLYKHKGNKCYKGPVSL